MGKRRRQETAVEPGSAVRMAGGADELGGRKVEIGGLKMTVVSDAAAEKAEMVVCMPADFQSPFSDNVVAACAQCGKAIIHRPHVPKRPAKVCIHCAIPLAGPVAGHA